MKKFVFHALKQVTSNFTTMDRRDKNKPSNLYFESTPTCSQDTEKNANQTESFNYQTQIFLKKKKTKPKIEIRNQKLLNPKYVSDILEYQFYSKVVDRQGSGEPRDFQN